jgi:CxxC motif-containing protein
MICIECPNSCNLSVETDLDRVAKVTGAKCPKGISYAASEIDNPVRIFTATVLTKGLSLKLIPVRTSKPIPKKDLSMAAEEVSRIRVTDPVKVGDIIVYNFLGLGVALIATREVG